jgi:hypothetical protein
MNEYKRYLATEILNEGHVVRAYFGKQTPIANLTSQVTYRSLSRALKVHANLAKQ